MKNDDFIEVIKDRMFDEYGIYLQEKTISKILYGIYFNIRTNLMSRKAVRVDLIHIFMFYSKKYRGRGKMLKDLKKRKLARASGLYLERYQQQSLSK